MLSGREYIAKRHYSTHILFYFDVYNFSLKWHYLITYAGDGHYSEPTVTITCVINENMSSERKVVNFEIKQNMDWIMTGGDDILYLITLRNLEIHLVIGLCCFEVCFGTGLLTGLQWYTHHLKPSYCLWYICTTVACLPPIRGLEKCRVIGLVAWPAPFSQSQASKSVFLFPEEHG